MLILLLLCQNKTALTCCCCCVFQEVRILDRQVLLGSGFPAPASVSILFEETFYNDQEQSYSILCISRPVEVDTSPNELSPPPPYCLKSVEDVREFLGRHAQKLDKFIHGFCQAFKEQERKGLRHHIVWWTLSLPFIPIMSSFVLPTFCSPLTTLFFFFSVL